MDLPSYRRASPYSDERHGLSLILWIGAGSFILTGLGAIGLGLSVVIGWASSIGLCAMLLATFQRIHEVSGNERRHFEMVDRIVSDGYSVTSGVNVVPVTNYELMKRAWGAATEREKREFVAGTVWTSGVDPRKPMSS